MLPSQSKINEIIEHSYKDLHVKGFDYICLKRTPEHTRKIYFFDGDVRKLPEVINPHDHRYSFQTTCLVGEVNNACYDFREYGDVYNKFSYLTPLNGGDGFAWESEVRLAKISDSSYGAGMSYGLGAKDIHTISLRADNTVLMLDQFADEVAIGVPTSTFCTAWAPSLDGLYNKFTEDEVVAYLKRIEEYAPWVLE